MRSIRRNGRRWHDRGAAAVEMAIVLPLLLLVIGGIVDFGRFFFYEIQLTNAVREGTRVAVVDPTADAEGRVRTAANDLTGLEVEPIIPCSGPGDVTVIARYPKFEWFVLGPATSLIPGGTSDNFEGEGALKPEAKAVMRCEV